MAQNTDYEKKMKKTLSALSEEFASIRAGRASPAVLDKIHVDYYGAPTPINQMASVSVTEARTLTIQPWDMTTLKSIEKAIQQSDLGINPQNDGRVLRLVFPSLTEERRREYVKTIRKYGEDAKVAVRAVRRDAIDKYKEMKKQSQMTEDDLKDAEKDMQDLTDRYCKDIDAMCEKKEKEVMSI